MVPPQGIGLKEEDGEKSEDGQRDDLLDDLELPERERAVVLSGTEPVGGDLEAVFEKGYSPAEQDDEEYGEFFYFGFEDDMAVPGEGHEGVGENQQKDSKKSSHR